MKTEVGPDKIPGTYYLRCNGHLVIRDGSFTVCCEVEASLHKLGDHHTCLEVDEVAEAIRAEIVD